MPALFADSLTRHALRLLRLSGAYNRRGLAVSSWAFQPESLYGARPQVLGSWHSPAVRETCRGVTYTGFNRLTCPARLTLPAVADSIGLGAVSDFAPLMMYAPGGRLSYSHTYCIPAVTDCAGFVFPAPCIRVNLFPGCPSILIRDVKDSIIRVTALVLGRWQCPPRSVVIFSAGCFPRHTNNIAQSDRYGKRCTSLMFLVSA